MFDLVIFDFDGTIADTIPLSIDIYNRLADRHRVGKIEDWKELRHIGLGEFMSRMGISLRRAPWILRDFLKEQRAMMRTAELFPGIREVVCELARTHPLAVVSSNKTNNIEVFLHAHGLRDQFTIVIGCGRLIGKERAIRRVARRRKVDPARCLYIGDEARDIEAARTARVPVAAVGWGIHSAEYLARHEPSFLVDHPSQLVELVRAGGNPD